MRIWHFGNVVIHDRSVVGANCTLHHGVTIGSRRAGGPLPRLGDNVSVVLTDVPDGATAAGNPARIVKGL